MGIVQKGANRKGKLRCIHVFTQESGAEDADRIPEMRSPLLRRRRRRQGRGGVEFEMRAKGEWRGEGRREGGRASLSPSLRLKGRFIPVRADDADDADGRGRRRRRSHCRRTRTCVVTFRNTNSATMLLYSMMNGADADVRNRDAFLPLPSFASRETRVHLGDGDVDRRCKSRISRSAAAAAELHISNQSGPECVGGREGKGRTANDLSRKPRSAKSKRAISLNGWPPLELFNTAPHERAERS